MKKYLTLFIAMFTLALSAVAGDNIKTNYRTALVMAYSPTNNVFEDDNIKLEIYNEQLWATNKTNKTIYVDLSQCFLVHNGSSYPMFDKHQNEQNASKKNVSTSIDEFVSIAPATGSRQNETKICNLAGRVYGKYSTSETPSGSFSEYEERMLNIINDMVNESLAADPKKQYLGSASRHLTEDESISNIGASLAYAFNKRAEEWIPIAISTWVSDLYLAPYYIEMPADLKKNEKKGFGVKKTETAKIHIKADSPFEFDADKSPVIVCDWTGDFNKGTFDLTNLWIINNTALKAQKLDLGQRLALKGAATTKMGRNNPLLATLFGPILDEISYKTSISFNGKDADWGKMTYMSSPDLSAFNNKR